MSSGRGVFISNTEDGSDVTDPVVDLTYCLPALGVNKNKLMVWNGSAFVPANIGGVSTSVINVVIDGGGSAITPGIKLDLEIPFACIITAATLLADQSGSIVIDIWKDTNANYSPTVADSITASAKPTISSAIKSQDTTLTGWTTSISAGDTLRFNVDSCTNITRVTMALKITKL